MTFSLELFKFTCTNISFLEKTALLPTSTHSQSYDLLFKIVNQTCHTTSVYSGPRDGGGSAVLDSSNSCFGNKIRS